MLTIPGAGDGNRTRVARLEGGCSTIELHRRMVPGADTAYSRLPVFPGCHLKGGRSAGLWLPRVEPLVGFEPTACWLQISCSTAELQRRILRCRSQYPWHGGSTR